MSELFLCIFALVCLFLLFHGLSLKDGIYQYPFLMGATFAGLILPQAVALINNPGAAPDRGVVRVLIMSCLCAVMCWIGYQFPIPSSWINKPVPQFSSSRLRIGAAIYVVIGLFFWMLVYRVAPKGSLDQNWSGIITIYVFFANLLDIGLAIILLELLKFPRKFSILVTLMALSLPVYRIIFTGRRTVLIFIILSIVLSVYFIRRKVISRFFALVGVPVATLLIISISEYRRVLENLPKTGQVDVLLQINPLKNLEILITQGKTLELRNAAILIDSVVESGRYEWGLGYWNKLIFRWVPAQLLGSDLKENLQLKLGLDYRSVWSEVYGYDAPIGSTFTGMAETFAQFDYFGCVVFALIAVFFKWLWYRAVYQDSFREQVAYIVLIIHGMTAIVGQTSNFLSQSIYYALFSLPIFLWAKSNQKYYLDDYIDET